MGELRVLATLAGRWREAVAAALVMLAAAAVGWTSGVWGGKHVAHADVRVMLTSCDASVRDRSPNVTSDLLRQVDLVRSDRVAREVLDTVRSAAVVSRHAATHPTAPSSPARRDERLQVALWEARCTLMLSYADADPRLAAEKVNAYADAYVRVHEELSTRIVTASPARRSSEDGLSDAEAIVLGHEAAALEQAVGTPSNPEAAQAARLERLNEPLRLYAASQTSVRSDRGSLPLAAIVTQRASPEAASSHARWYAGVALMLTLAAGITVPLWRESRNPVLRCDSDVTLSLGRILLGRVSLRTGPVTPRAPAPLLSYQVAVDATRQEILGRSLGDLLRQRCGLDDAQIEAVRQHQADHGTLFGESAQALGLVTAQDLGQALAEQRRDVAVLEQGPAAIDARSRADDSGDDTLGTFRDIQARLMQATASSGDPADSGLAIAVISPDSGDGRTHIAANLAVAASELGLRTLLVDADLRQPSQHEVFGLQPSRGLAGALRGHLDQDLIRDVPGVPGLRLLPAGAAVANGMPLLQLPVFRDLLRAAAKRFDVVLVDTPPGLSGPAALEVARHCDAVVAVGRRGQTPIAALDALLRLAASPTRVAGVVMNAA